MDGYACVILSDIGSNTLLLSNQVFAHGSRQVNRLDLVRDYVKDGGAFLMIGGYMSFSGIDGKARYGQTSVADVLPVSLLDHDDRVECPEGLQPEILQKNHPVFSGISGDWPHFLGYNRTIAKPGNTTVLASLNGDPFVAVGSYGKGRTAAFTSDCAPHWGPREFTDWAGYNRFWPNLIDWLAGNQGSI